MSLWRRIECQNQKNAERLRHINCSIINCSSSSRTIKSSFNSTRYNCQKICSTRRPEAILKTRKKATIFKKISKSPIYQCIEDFTYHRKKINRAIVFSCSPFPSVLKYRNHRWDIHSTVWKTRFLQKHVNKFSWNVWKLKVHSSSEPPLAHKQDQTLLMNKGLIFLTNLEVRKILSGFDSYHKIALLITYMCQNFGIPDVLGQIPKSIYQASYLLHSDFQIFLKMFPKLVLI